MLSFQRTLWVAPVAVIVLVPAGSGAQLDHLRCFKVKDEAKFAAEATLSALQAQFGIDESCSIQGKGRLFCVPVSKRVTAFEDKSKQGIAPLMLGGQTLEDDRVCYKIKCPKREIDSGVVTDQFGTRAIEKFKSELLCTPAVEGVPATTSTTTASSTTTTPPSGTIQVTCNRNGVFVASDHPLFADPVLDPDHFSMWEFEGNTTGFSAPAGVRIVCRAKAFFSDTGCAVVDVTEQATWSTNLPAVAQVAADGIVTTIGVGSAIITATLDAMSDDDTLQVNGGTLRGSPAIAVSNLVGEPDPLSRPAGVTIPYGAVGNYGVDGGAEAPYDITEFADWTTSSAPVATVNNTTDKGLVTTNMASGSPVQIIATYQTVMGSVSLNVTAGP